MQEVMASSLKYFRSNRSPSEPVSIFVLLSFDILKALCDWKLVSYKFR
jgi:hypothetical protein